MAAFTIGVDIGTTSTKAALLDVDRGVVADASRSSELDSVHAGWAEASPERWYDNTISTIAELVSRHSLIPGDVAAIATTGMVPAVVAVGPDGRALRPAILQNDARARTEVVELRAAIDPQDVLSSTGSALTQQSVGPTLSWLRRHEPVTWAGVKGVCGSYDWVLRALGASPHVERNWALESGLYHLGGAAYEPIMDAAMLDPQVLPPVRSPGETVGGLSAAAADATGLSPGTPLVVGGADHVLSAYVAGLDQVGDWLVKLGGAGDILAVADGPLIDARLYLDAHAIPGLWLPNGCMATSGSLLRWLSRVVGVTDLAALDEAASERAPADLLCLPYFLGEKSPLHDPDLRGAFIGLHLGHGQADLYRAALEGIAFGFRHHVEVMHEAGLTLERARVTNGGSRSMLWKTIHASVLGTRLQTFHNHPGASAGAAVVAAVGVGALDGWSDVHRFVRPGSDVEPDPSQVARYDEAYQMWREAGETLATTSHRLASRATSH